MAGVVADGENQGHPCDCAGVPLFARSEICNAAGMVFLFAGIWGVLFGSGTAGSLNEYALPGLVQLLFSMGLLCGLFTQSIRSQHAARPARWMCGVAFEAMLWVVIMVLLLGRGSAAVPVLDVLWVGAGASTGALLAVAMHFWTGYRGKSLMILLSACAVSACALDVLGANLKPVAQTVFFCVLLPVASLLLRRNAVRAADSDELSSIGPVVWARKYYRACRPLALALPLYGFVYGFSCSIGANIYAESIGPFSAFVALSAPGIVMLAFSSCIRRIDYTLLQTVAVATALAFLPLLFLHGQGVAGALHLLDHIFLLACVNGFYLATCALQVDVASVRALPLERACCTGQMLHVFGTVVGWILGLGIYFYYGMEGDPLLIATAMMIAALVLCAMMLGKSSETDANSEDALQRRLIAQCAIVARDCGLSAREAELLGLTAQGLDSAAIEGRLFISKNTVKTHMYHIYRKTGVHSREELVAFVNSHDDVT